MTSDLVARYKGGELHREAVESWLRHRGEPVGQASEAALETLALLQTLEQRALGPDGVAQGRLAFQLEKLTADALYKALRAHSAQQVVISDAQVEQTLEEHRDRLVRGNRVRLRNLFKSVPADASPAQRLEVRQQVEALRQEVLAGADFGEVALRESESQTRGRRGRMGVARRGELPKPIEDIAFALEEGEVSEIIESPEGFTLLKCDAIVEGRVLTEDEGRERIRDYLRRQEVNRRWLEVEQQLLDAAQISIDLPRVLEADSNAESPEQSAAEDAVAQFAGRKVSLQEMAWILGHQWSKLRPTLSEEQAGQRVRNRFQQYVLQALGAAKARELGLHNSPRLAERLRWRRRETVAAEGLAQMVAQELVAPTETELKAFVQANPKRFVHPAQDLAAVIRVDLNSPGGDSPGGAEQVYRQLSQARQQIERGEKSFARVAAELSQHPSAVDGGTLTWLDREGLAQLGPEVFRAVRQLEPGVLSTVLRQDQNVWLVQKLDSRSRRAMTEDEALLRASAILGQQRAEQLQAAIEARLRDGLNLQIKPVGG